MSRKIKAINVSCWDLNRPLQGLKADGQNRIVIERDVLPIIFVPGIMGSRLGRSQEIPVWDPDNQWFMLTNYGRRKADAALKKSFLVGETFSENYLQVLNDNANAPRSRSTQEDKSRSDRKWGGVSWSSYGMFLEKLQTREWDKTINLFFEFPVHCFGYNWTASNRVSGQKLAGYIEDVIKTYMGKSRRCEKVILVTHSMGGLVARAACKLSHIENKVLAVIHGVQPADGSPAAYWRMKGGFERPHSIPGVEPMQWFRDPKKSSAFVVEKAGNQIAGHIAAWVLGTDGEEVTALLGNMPGGLQLLPNKHYRNNSGSGRWLELPEANGKSVALPTSDPYEEIYRKQGVYYRLVKPEWLNPGALAEKACDFEDEDWDLYLDLLAEAERFHDDLFDETTKDGYCHPETYQFHATGLASADSVVFTRSEHNLWETAKRIVGSVTEDLPTDWKGAAKALVFTAAGLGLPLAKKLIDVACDLAGGALIKDSYWYVNRGGYRDRVNAADSPATEGRLNVVTMQLPDGSGDGTVPESSARALKLPSDTRRTFCVGDKGSYKAGLEKIKSIDAPDFDEAFFDRAHEPIFKSASAHHITFTAIENICRKEIKRRLGTNG